MQKKNRSKAMVEYIARKDLDFLNDFCIDGGKYAGLRLDEVFDELATKDVIERTKIDKAIAEIEDLNLSWVASHYEDRFYGFQQEVLEILKRNIGE